MDVQELVRQIGTGNLLAISGGRVQRVSENVARLPVGCGFAVVITYNPGSDTYTVERTFNRTPRGRVLPVVTRKGRRIEVHAAEVGEAAYYASCYRSYDEREWVTK